MSEGMNLPKASSFSLGWISFLGPYSAPEPTQSILPKEAAHLSKLKYIFRFSSTER